VLIDTAGLGQRDRALAASCSGCAPPARSAPAGAAGQHQLRDMDEVVRRFGAPTRRAWCCKLDETGRFGNALSVAVDHALPITWVTDGQDVPEDLHRPARQSVLRLEDLRRAADMPCNPELNHAVA
jgi:flagellar biosynthesis protein FlhF